MCNYIAGHVAMYTGVIMYGYTLCHVWLHTLFNEYVLNRWSCMEVK